MQPSLPELPTVLDAVCEMETVCCNLNLDKAEITRHPDDSRQIVPDRWFTA
ncbi:MAG: hypothetical protein C5S52_00140 [ANME-2 cluster archaeon]|nr:hypothetical protein [ANME-2 cluster archaeon]